MKKTYILLILTIILFGTGCRRRPANPKRYMKRDVDFSELVGTWRVTDSTLERLKKEGYKKFINKEDHQLILKHDMTCEICTFFYMPPFPTPQDEDRYYTYKRQGKWKVIKTGEYAGRNKDVQAVEIEIGSHSKNDNAVYINKITIKFFLAEMDEKITIWYYIGDPDYTEYFDFVKENG